MNGGIDFAVIPMCGKGSRLLPLTHAVQKELLPLGEMSLLHRMWREAVEAGIKQFILVVEETSRFGTNVSSKSHYEELNSASLSPEQKKTVEDYISLLDCVVKVIHPLPGQPGGLANAVLSAEGTIGSSPFAVMLPDDVILKGTSGLPSLADHWRKCGGGWGVNLWQIQRSEFCDFGVVDASKHDGNIYHVHSAIEKPNAPEDVDCGYGIVGRYIFTHEVFDQIRASREEVLRERSQSGFHITTAISKFAGESSVFGILIESDYYHAGTMKGYKSAWKRVIELEMTSSAPLRGQR